MNIRARLSPAAIVCYWCCGLAVLAAALPWVPLALACGLLAVSAVVFLPWRRLLWALLVAVPLIVLTPLLNHRGAVVWFYMGYTPVTVEAVQLGLRYAASLFMLFLWFQLLAAWVDVSALLMLSRAVLPRVTLMLHMLLRQLPLLARRARATRDMVRLRTGAAVSRRKRLAQGASALQAWMVWSMESGMGQAIQLRARGYGAAHTTRYGIIGWHMRDTVVALVGVVLLALSLWVSPYWLCGLPVLPLAVEGMDKWASC